MQHILERLVTPPSGMTTAEFARRADVNRSTIHRIARGETDPALGTLRELAFVHGLDLDLSLRPLSDPDAAAAARVLLDEAMGDYEITTGTRRWISRLDSFADPLDIIDTAGRASAPAERPGAVLLRGDRSALRLSSAGTAAGVPWAVSGWAGLLEAEGVAATSGPSIVWTTDPEATARMLLDTHRRVTSPANAQVVVAPAADAVFVDAWESGPTRLVAPVQILLDCIGLGGELEELARRVAEGWSER
ncbi:helix-turn-helix transcriptional regulator [Microbacterium suaedae]|uniref:helix-turn-helix transcriptional regulator n=1 Tax=Microbacterium suaedae TaxID=2067813 RepID=UPI0013A66F0F|nr:helix-turn-helix domain-containing protein [Microbacterium suaedae]